MVAVIPSGASKSAMTAVKNEASTRYVQNRRGYGMTAVVYRSLQEIASGANFGLDCSVCFAWLRKRIVPMAVAGGEPPEALYATQVDGIGRGLFRDVCKCLCRTSLTSAEEIGLVRISAAPFDKASARQFEVCCAL
jgi:hypothetical protein